MDRILTIGRLARAAGVNVETVRYYQRRGLVAKPERPLNSVRRYSEDSVSRIRFIKRAQDLGFIKKGLDAKSLYDLTLLNEILVRRGLPPVTGL